MANIILPQAQIVTSSDDATYILIEQDGIIYRINISHINSLIENKINNITNAENVLF